MYSLASQRDEINTRFHQELTARITPLVKAIPDLQTVGGWENIRESSDLTSFGAGGRWSKPQAIAQLHRAI